MFLFITESGGIFPIEDYEFVVLVEDDKESWNGINSTMPSIDNVIGIVAPSFITNIKEGTLLGVTQIVSKADNFLLTLKGFIKKLVTEKEFRNNIHRALSGSTLSFWNSLTTNGDIVGDIIVDDKHVWH